MLRHNTVPLKRKNKLSVMPQAKERTPLVMKIAKHCNLIKPVCNSMFGKEHSLAHRMATGATVAIVGVIISKSLGHMENAIVEGIGDAVGYGLHGLGITPFIEWIAKTFGNSE